MNHTESCIKYQEKHTRKVHEYKTAWPNHCTYCRGNGVISYEEDPSPYGVSLPPGSLTFEDPCPNCTEVGKCPRCGVDWAEEAYTICSEAAPCPACGWNWSNSESRPEPFECGCWYTVDQY